MSATASHTPLPPLAAHPRHGTSRRRGSNRVLGNSAAATDASSANRASKDRAYRVLAWVLVAAALGTLAALFFYGWQYYRLPLVQRFRHPLHQQLKPGGLIGRKLGVIGTVLMLLNLLYSAKRRIRWLRKRFGSQRLWLEIHVFCGLFGPGLLIFHSAFLTQNVIAKVTAISCLIVVMAGVLGRYVYAQIPRNVHGGALEGADLQALQRTLLDRIAQRLPVGSPVRATVLAYAAPAPPAKVSAPRLVLASLQHDLLWIFRSVKLRGVLHRAGVPSQDAQDVLHITRRLGTLGLRTTYMLSFQKLLARWRGVHLKLALVMIACMVIHIAVVSAMGYGLW